jgi:PAS domain S-box-containing protein
MKQKRCSTENAVIDCLESEQTTVAEARMAKSPGAQSVDSLNETGELFRLVFDSLRDQVYVLDREWRVAAVNSSARKFVAMPEEKILGKLLVELWPGIGRTITMQAIQADMEANKRILITDEFTTPDGGKAWLKVYLCPVSRSIILATTDITEHKHKERALEDEAALLRTILDHTADALIVCDANRRISFANRAAKQLWHRDLVGTMIGVPRPMCAEAYDEKGENLPPAAWAILGALQGNTTNREFHIVWPDGHSFDIHTTTVPVRADSGAVTAAVSTTRDITDRKQLQKTLEELCAEKERLYREAKEQTQKMSWFIRALIHELKTPLTPMLGTSEMLLDRLENAELRQMAENINRAAQSLDRRIGDLADLAKGEVGLLNLRYGFVDMKAMLHEIIDYVRPEATRRQQELRLKIASRVPNLYADEDRVRQVVLNLLNNALKFTPSEGRITLQVHAMHTGMVVEIVNSGPPVAPEVLEQLSGAYRLWERGNGDSVLGIGLPLCRMIVELHRGRFWVRNEAERGNIFGFSIPLIGAGMPSREARV